MEHLIIAALSVAWPAYWFYRYGYRFNTDGATYVMYAKGETPASPFHTRIIAAWIMRLIPWHKDWGVGSVRTPKGGIDVRMCMNPASEITLHSINIAFVSAALYLIGLKYGALAVLLVGASPWIRIMVNAIPCQADQPALFLMALALYLPAPWGYLPAVVSGLAHERVPPMLAAVTLDPWFLLGLLPWAAAKLIVKPGKPHDFDFGTLDHPIASARYSQNSTKLAWHFLPILLFWAGFRMEMSVILSLILAYGQCFIAVDKARLFSWAIFALLPGTLATLALMPAGIAALVVICCLCVMHWATEAGGL
jgi:hypothetical protein